MTTLATTSKVRDRALAAGYRSGLEDRVAGELTAQGVLFKYEDPASVIRYRKPETANRYTPDFILPNGLIIETKGRFVTADRKKHLFIQEQHPTLDIRFVFSRSATPITKGSPTTYAMWCEKNGFTYADKSIPKAWISEAPKVQPTAPSIPSIKKAKSTP